MSVVINTNSAATMAAGHLSNSSSLLHKSLNRLSSGSRIVNPEDDAGGLAVSMKLSAASHRMAAVGSNIANSTSYLQTQDGALSVVGKVLSRISELKTLYLDPTKNTSDLANYDAEFAQLQSQLGSLADEQFNGLALFGSSAVTVHVDEGATSSVVMDAVNLLGTGVVPWSNVSGVTPGSGWTASDPGIAMFTATEIAFHADGTLTSTQSNISGPYTMNFTFTRYSAGGTTTVSNGGSSLDLTALAGVGPSHSLAITVDSNGDATWSMDSGALTGSVAGFASPSGAAVTFTNSGGADFHVDNFALTSTGSAGSGNVNAVKTAGSLGSVSLSTIGDALQEVATYRANNGGQQSRLGFATEVLTTNKVNIEAANSRITDLDVAAESTRLARFNVLTQAGTAMLSQANQSTQIALKLLG